jgi:hypothetical protein
MTQGYFVRGIRGWEFPPNLKIAKFWGEHFPPKWNMNIIINIKLVSDNLEYKNG